MFSTRLNDRRCTIPCIVLTEAPIIHSFVVDTGAKYTCCSYRNINPELSEQMFTSAPRKCLGGLVEGAGIWFYGYRVNQFTIGNISLGEREIWVTFDRLATDDVLGMDILKDVFFLNVTNRDRLIFSDKADEIREYLAAV